MSGGNNLRLSTRLPLQDAFQTNSAHPLSPALEKKIDKALTTEDPRLLSAAKILTSMYYQQPDAIQLDVNVVTYYVQEFVLQHSAGENDILSDSDCFSPHGLISSSFSPAVPSTELTSALHSECSPASETLSGIPHGRTTSFGHFADSLSSYSEDSKVFPPGSLESPSDRVHSSQSIRHPMQTTMERRHNSPLAIWSTYQNAGRPPPPQPPMSMNIRFDEPPKRPYTRFNYAPQPRQPLHPHPPQDYQVFTHPMSHRVNFGSSVPNHLYLAGVRPFDPSRCFTHSIQENRSYVRNTPPVHIDKAREETPRTKEVADIIGAWKRNPDVVTVETLVEYLAQLANDTIGVQILQAILNDKKKRGKLIEASIPLTLILAQSRYGNIYLQSIFSLDLQEYNDSISEKLEEQVLSLALHPYGCRIIQRALTQASTQIKSKLAVKLRSHTIECIYNQNGNHVIQAVIEHLPETEIDYIIEDIQDTTAETCCHVYGCRIVQRLLETGHHDKLTKLLEGIFENINQLCKNQYGNYVVQHVLEYGRPSDKSTAKRYIMEAFQETATHRFASNVTEKMLFTLTPEQGAELVDIILKPPEQLLAIATDKYGNYVIQKLLAINLPEEKKQKLITYLQKHVPALRNTLHGKHIAKIVHNTTKQKLMSGEKN